MAKLGTPYVRVWCRIDKDRIEIGSIQNPVTLTEKQWTELEAALEDTQYANDKAGWEDPQRCEPIDDSEPKAWILSLMSRWNLDPAYSWEFIHRESTERDLSDCMVPLWWALRHGLVWWALRKTRRKSGEPDLVIAYDLIHDGVSPYDGGGYPEPHEIMADAETPALLKFIK